MKKVLFVTNIEVPYRAKFFNDLAEKCELTVLYERKKSSNRDKKWTSTVERKYRVKYLHGIKFRKEYSFSLGILRYLSGFDEIIVGCINSPVQILFIFTLRLLRKSYSLNFDGEIFINDSGIKSKIKLLVMKGAKYYLCAGLKSSQTVKSMVGKDNVYSYFFSSLSDCEIEYNSQVETNRKKNLVLVIGQYEHYKGLDIALEASKLDESIKYLFVGMGKKTNSFLELTKGYDNIKVIPFMQKEQLSKVYRECSMLVLPSRKECWGLVINEAASYGTPIVSTWGSGAAVEFLSDNYSQFLAEPGNPTDLLSKIRICLTADFSDYSTYLYEKCRLYSIDHMVDIHCKVLEL